jgi:hypothetical protein
MKDTIKTYTQPSFLICVVLLAAAGSSTSMVKSYFGIKRIKLPIPLKKPLDLMNETALASYKVVDKKKIDNPDVVEQLGTEEYIQWVFEDTQVDSDSPLRFCLLFITYYTGTSEQVWHTPEECYFGVGNVKHSADNQTYKVSFGDDSAPRQQNDGKSVKVKEIPVRRVVFGRKQADLWRTEARFPVFYTFSVNGDYVGGRTGVRIKMEMNLTAKYSYFSKVEWQFYNSQFGTKIYPNKQEAVEANQKLLNIILPVLESDHWPDREKLKEED